MFISKNPSLSVTVLCFEKYSPQPDDPQHQLASSMIYYSYHIPHMLLVFWIGLKKRKKKKKLV